MQVSGLIWFAAGIAIGGVLIWLLSRGGLKELRKAANDARERENEAKAIATKLDQRCSDTSEELKSVVEQKGKYQSEAARIDEIRSLLASRGSEIEQLNDRIASLDREKTEALKDAEAANRRAIELVDKEQTTQAAIVAAKDDQISKLNEFISQARGVLTTEFKALSADALKDASEQLAKTADGIAEKYGQLTTADVKLNKQHIETMLKPVEETIKRLDKHVEESDLARTKAEALLDEQVKRLAGASESLTNALRKPVVRGSWGEMTLENALGSAGLEADIDYVLQHKTDADDGRKRTDAIINLPKGRKLVIDSKNLMESYIALASATDEARRTVLSDIHSKALRGHIKDLSSKEYWRRYECLDCVFLFIPHDGMYHAAIKDEAELIREACDKRVFIANPMSLIPLLKAVRYVLDQERLNKSAVEIGRIGADLYVDLTRFAKNMATIGSRIKATVDSYNDAIPGLDRYIVAKSRQLKQLGSAKGADAELPEAIAQEPRFFSSRELRASNILLDDGDPMLNMAAAAENESQQ